MCCVPHCFRAAETVDFGAEKRGQQRRAGQGLTLSCEYEMESEAGVGNRSEAVVTLTTSNGRRPPALTHLAEV